MDFHFERNSSCPWYIIIYPAPTVIINTANTPNTTISFSKTVSKTLSIVSPAPAQIRSTLPGVISETLISKLASLILLEAPQVKERGQKSINISTTQVKNNFFIALKRE
jgi:hypothetical protein